MMRAFIAASVLMVGATTTALADDAVRVTPASYSANAAPSARLDPEGALSIVNELRAKSGLGALTLNSALSAAAASHARDLAEREVMSHFGADGSSPIDRAVAAGYDAITIGENVSSGQRNYKVAIAEWFGSDPHRRTLLLSSAADMGIALVEDPTSPFRTYWALVVGEQF